ncbi:peptide deformylase [Candidatus Vidania fulgoroideae]|uniref:Peptide deformylase n=1 Tax=Candidatus Vidania fulgoroideorum TaxID=881286 RepID=A0A974X7P0_9PROT|nr:peptide deformylase [Candidatus Vidania fulgoroideae]
MNIIKYPSLILSKISMPVFSNEGLHNIILSMRRILLSLGGIGISAPQIGHNICAFVISFNSKLITIINPVIRYMSSSFFNSIEGCLSIPGCYLNILRSKYVLIEYLDLNYNLNRIFLKGLFSACLQHEMDHINGILIVNRV